jgi:hypothetical protein
LDDNGNPVPGGKLIFTRTGTSTPQDTYSDSTLLTPNSNPVVLNSAGRITTKIYGNPATGFDYRVAFTTSADVAVWSPVDDVTVDVPDVALSSNVALENAANDFTNNQTISAQNSLLVTATAVAFLIQSINSTKTQIGTQTTHPLHIITNSADRIIIPAGAIPNFADDAAAAAGGVPLLGLYRTTSTLKIRVA